MEEDEVEFDPAQNYGPVIEELENQERAIVLFNPVNNPILHNPSNVSISLCPDLVSGFKGKSDSIPSYVFIVIMILVLLGNSLILCLGCVF